jgi:aconitate hydratase
VSNKYGIGFWKPGAGIIHQVVLENYVPGGMMIGTDTYCKCRWFRNGGYWCWWRRCSDVMSGMAWELKFQINWS